MSLLDDLQAKADLNGDGKLSTEDLESLKDGLNNEELEKLKDLADHNNDGKIDIEDIKGIDMGAVVDAVKDKLGGMFGGK